ncbi:uncharacterized protein TNCV_5042771 [Trichonephila clavipes]|nr:uncharacterized protein TNCV_5042771 [Trichonephila clavipes]
MLSAPDKALLVKLFYMNEELATMRKLKNVKSGKGPLTAAGLLKHVKRFEETGTNARAGTTIKCTLHCCRNGSDCPKQLQGPAIDLPPSSVHNILRRILQLYPYMQSCHELLPADTAQREAFSGPKKKWNRIPPGFLTWTDEAHFFMVTLTTIIVAFGRPLIDTEAIAFPKSDTWCVFMGSFII